MDDRSYEFDDEEQNAFNIYNDMDETVEYNDDHIEITPKDIEQPQKDDEKNFMQDFYKKTVKDVDEFDNKAWHTGSGYTMPNYPFMTEKFEGISRGLYVWAGKPNHGKSAIAMNTTYDLCMNPDNKLFGIYFSLDDDKDEIIPRLIAMDQSIPISVVSKPQRYRELADAAEGNKSVEFETYLAKRQTGIDRLKENASHMIIVDSQEVTDIEDMYNYIKAVQWFIKSKDPENNLVIVIDSIYDVRLKNARKDPDEAFKEVARTIKQWTVDFDCPIFVTAHMKKVNSHRRPQLDDVKDSVVLQYEASVIFLVFNDVSENKQGADVFGDAEGDGTKTPILEIDWAKNKKSSYKGRSFCEFAPNYSKTKECDEQGIAVFDSIINQI